ncbi:MAG TPA: endopeptidase La [Verrucomicrobiota bacterium]|nr:endopeptidase La [Verrucomicrobiales bacterium]HRI15830.1 endopeptidase La [Verrucomicrobiota bacterium]
MNPEMEPKEPAPPSATTTPDSPTTALKAQKPEETDGPKIPEVLAILPMRNLVLFPGLVAPVNIGRPGSIKLIEETLTKTKIIGVLAQRNPEQQDPLSPDLFRFGTAAMVLKLVRQAENAVVLVLHGLRRFAVRKVVQEQPYLLAEVDLLESLPLPPASDKEWEAKVKNLRDSAAKLIELTPEAPDEMRLALLNIDNPGNLADFLAGGVNMETAQRQEILEELDVVRRVHLIQQRVSSQLEILQIQQKLQKDVSSQFSDMQRRAYLREQIKAIQRELGEGEQEVGAQVEQLRKRLEETKPPKEVVEQAERELKRLNYVPPASAEFSVIVSYVETIAELPWSKLSEDNLDLHRAQKILDRDHYDLEKVKRRLIEYLAVRKLNPTGRSPILCFLGPPGVGKTSLGQSIADALGRKFTRLSLGGMRDEAEIRGHRRTYIGSMPGRLIQELRRLGTRNPVIMLDEVDKIGADFRGDPASALLEVLDPAQNHAFVDHYLDVPFDLTQVMFITTANVMDPIPPALRDRMEVIAIPGYTDHEKLAIARNYLVKRQLNENGLKPEQCPWTAPALKKVVEDYTRESGVRELERQVGAVCRAVAAQVAKGERQNVTVTPEFVQGVLGPARYIRETRLKTGRPGVATGLAYTPVGGEVLHIEATRYPGKGEVTLTGQMGEVMEESVEAALSLVRSRAKELGIEPDAFKNTDIHVHVPSGAVPKDGPSAGIAMFTALASLFTNTPVRANVAMTGEVTLRGLVLPIGGLKEKTLGAVRAGIRHVIIPKLNEKDLPEVAAEVKKKLKFTLAENVDEVLAAALVKKLPHWVVATAPPAIHSPKPAQRSRVRRLGRVRHSKRTASATG